VAETATQGSRLPLSRLTARRNNMRELLDGPASPAALAENLREIRLINGGLGWTAATLRAVALLAGSSPGAGWRCLDVATGSADLPLALLRWGRRHGLPVEAHGVDASPAVLAEAYRHVGHAPVRLHQADARFLPFADRAFDVVTCALSLHHFDPPDAVLVLRELRRVTRRAWLVVDLERGSLAYLGAWALRCFLRNDMTRHDAPASVLRAYTLAEWQDLLVEAGLEQVRAKRQFPFRLLAGEALALPR
jgi:ubiquinone/menaquinone biosynthesis C-methylase UbiE